MDDKIDIFDFRNDAPTIKIHVADKECETRVFFNMNCCQALIESHESGNDYRVSFAKSIFIMCRDTDSMPSGELSEHDFLNTSDNDLLSILNAILENDSRLKAEYVQVQGANEYERFYKANMAVLCSVTKGLSKTLKDFSEKLERLNQPFILSFPSPHNQLVASPAALQSFQSAFSSIQPLPHFERPSALLNLPKYHFPVVQSALIATSQVNFSQLSSILSSIPQPSMDIQNLIAPLNNIALSIQAINEGIAQSLQFSLNEVAEAINSLLSSMDFTLWQYPKKWNEQRKVFLSYGWFYIEELPESLVTYVYERKDQLQEADVDTIIVSHFRQNRCATLKRMVKTWNQLPYFACRKVVFHEALVNHSRRYFNSSIMMLTLQTEGVITDFVRLKLQTSKYKVKQVLLDIKGKLEKNDEVSIFEAKVFSDIIARIETAFNEGFDCANPDKASNQSRNKIAHGHVYEPETEANSLKQFLYLNKVYHLLLLLSQE